MSLQDAINQLAALAPKQAGHLIRHDDWNSLIAVLQTYGASLTTQDTDLATLKGQVALLETQLGTVSSQLQLLDGRVDALEQQIEPLLDNYLVTLSCNQLTYAMAEFCEITAKVTDLRGNPLSAPYPWVDFIASCDFIASWGCLRAKSGFTSRSGAGENSLSVQVNSQGIARVLLRSASSEGFTQSEEEQLSVILDMQVPQMQMSVRKAFMDAATPMDEGAQQAYRVINREYERKDAKTMRSYADSYHARHSQWHAEPAGPAYGNQWLDYRATVLALAKPDSNPQTPDGVRGSASLQVTFRDWLWSWGGYYTDDTEDLVIEVLEEMHPVFETEDLYVAFEEKFQKNYQERGLLGRLKYMEAMREVLDRVDPGDDPRIQTAREEIERALDAQGATELYGMGRSTQEALVMKAHIGHGKQVGVVRNSVDNIALQVEETQGVQAAVQVLEGRMQASERLGQNIHSGLTLINDNVRAINPLDESSIKANVQKISVDIASLKAQMG
ncbi:MAG: hypothetical protein P8X63_01210 [Desulfuromonadaceae bacterium]